ncbi:hypothetical protein [Kitasatospora sp. NPDC059327]|uniref:hypothetical protein n=1 Tax=Kitasatospora sp. NPDC059327 TaxID=3346803 RepID=UPI0036C44849
MPRDWTRMKEHDFDADTPPPLFDVRPADRPVPAVADNFGTESLFGAPVPAARPAPPAPKRPPRTPAHNTLF